MAVHTADVRTAVLNEATVIGSNVREIAARYGVAERTARTWILQARDGTGPAPARPSASAWALLSDWHLGALVESKHMAGRWAYDTRIARERVEKLTRRIVGELRLHGAEHNIERLYLLWAGDIVDGTKAFRGQRYRLELRTCAAQRNFAESLIMPMIEALVSEGVPLVCISCEGNHSRSAFADEEEPDENHETRLFNEIAEQTASEAVRWAIRDYGAEIQDPVTGRVVAVEHGRYMPGSKHGALTPGSFQHVYAASDDAGRKFDAFCVGHRHVPGYWHGRTHLFCNGSLTGYNEFARDRRFRPCLPSQWFFGLTEGGLAWQSQIILGSWPESEPDADTGVLFGPLRDDAA